MTKSLMENLISCAVYLVPLNKYLSKELHQYFLKVSREMTSFLNAFSSLFIEFLHKIIHKNIWFIYLLDSFENM